MHTSQTPCLLELTTSKSYGSRESQLMQQGRLSSNTSLLIQATGCRTACKAPPGLLPAPDSCTHHRFTIQRTIQQDAALQLPRLSCAYLPWGRHQVLAVSQGCWVGHGKHLDLPTAQHQGQQTQPAR